MKGKLKNRKLIAIIAAAVIAVVFLGLIMARSSDYAKPAYEEYVDTIVERHVESGETYVTLTENYRKYNDKDMNMEKVLSKHNEAFASEITVLVADELTDDEYNKLCKDLYMDLGRNHVKCNISVCMVDKEDLDTDPSKLLENNKTLSKGQIN